ncbi:MAG: putative ABC transporter permease [Clostridiaceae bacterium]|jgi:uncharacterized membrane protein|nr:putative ABC transporter permease [Clostridiaceae bacterium]
MYDVIIYFILFSFVGWLCETVFCSIAQKKFVYRGFLSGPICPVYGFGGLIVVYLLAPFRENILLLFLMGMLATTVLEYLTSYILELAFQTRWWDYSERKFNLNGRVCLPFSLMFGVLSVLGVKLIYPVATLLIAMIPEAGKPIIALIFVTIFMADFILTVYGLLSFNGSLRTLEHNYKEFRQKLADLQPSQADHQPLAELIKEEWFSLKDVMENAGENLSAEDKELLALYTDKEERLKMISAFTRGQMKRISQAFPNMRNLRHQNYIALFKQKRKQGIANKKREN